MIHVLTLSLFLAQIPAAPAPSPPSPPSPAGEVLAALTDARRLPAEQCRQTRYLTMYAVPAERRAEFVKVLAFHCNSLSREAELIAPRRITATLYAVELDNYGWAGTTYGPLATIDPWFHAKATDGKTETLIHAPWLPVAAIAELATLTGSVVPILRADWFIAKTGEQRSYYDFLSLKTQTDAEKLAGLDRAAAIRIRKELAAIVTDSAVTLNNRQIFRFGSVGGAWWETRDVESSTERKNAVRNLDGDYKPDAHEIYFSLPNGLFGFALTDSAGKLIDTAPDKIASDGASTSTDRRVRVGISCIRCHAEGLRPIDDWSRKVFRVGNETALGSPDREKARRLKQLYLGPLQKALVDDRARYAESLKGLTGWTPEAASKAYAAAWAAYESGTLLPADVARELGCTEAELLGALRGQLKGSGLTDLAMAGLLSDPPVPMIRAHLEEFAPVLMSMVQKGK